MSCKSNINKNMGGGVAYIRELHASLQSRLGYDIKQLMFITN